jgi:hypothetical protein
MTGTHQLRFKASIIISSFYRAERSAKSTKISIFLVASRASCSLAVVIQIAPQYRLESQA